MGIIILPFLLGAIALFIMAFIFIIKSFIKRDITIAQVLSGLLLSVVIYAVLFIDYKFSSKAYALGTYFMFTFFMIFVPYTVGVIFKEIPGKVLKFVFPVCMISVVFSGLFIICFQQYTFDIITFLNIPKYY